jgi:Flp pilus assembly protein TadG
MGSSSGRQRERGATTTELVVVMPFLILLVFLVVHVGVWLHATQIARAAAQEGARAARVETGSAEAGQARAESFLAELGDSVLEDEVVTVESDGDSARVEVRGRALAVLPFLHFDVVASSEGPVERFRNPDEAP